MTIRDDQLAFPIMAEKSTQIPASQFKANCLRLMDQVARQRTSIVITKRGKPIAKLVPISDEPIDIFGRMKGTIRIVGDIVGPIDDLEWTGDAENI
jgi:prevent-host-death family protein